MHKFLHTVILDNEVRNYLMVACIIIFFLIFKRLLSRYIASLLFLPIRLKWKFIERKVFISMLLRPLSWLITITISVMVIDKIGRAHV